jgi:hypothetical protein
MKTIYVFFASPAGRKIMYLSTIQTIGPVLFAATTTEELVNLADAHLPAAVDFSDNRFPRHASPIEKVISTRMFSKYVRLNNKAEAAE